MEPQLIVHVFNGTTYEEQYRCELHPNILNGVEINAIEAGRGDGIHLYVSKKEVVDEREGVGKEVPEARECP